MDQKEYEMPEEYKKNLAHLTEFLEAREGYREQIRDASARGVRVSAADKAMIDEKLREFDISSTGWKRVWPKNTTAIKPKRPMKQSSRKRSLKAPRQ